MKAHTVPIGKRAQLPGGGGSSKREPDDRLLDKNEETTNDSGRGVTGGGRNLTGGDSIRALSWDEALLIIGTMDRNGQAASQGSGLPSPGIKFVHDVPAQLRHVGCMWLPDGREDRRCGKSPAWTMGANLNIARVYCELHGRLIALRRAQIRAARRTRGSAG